MRRHERGQALPLVVLVGMAILLGGLGVFWLGRAHVAKARAQTAADLAAISAGRRLREVLPQMLAGPEARADEWRGRVEKTAAEYARRNGATVLRVTWPEGSRWPPTTVQVTVAAPGPAGTMVLAAARAALMPGVGALPDAAVDGTAGQYRGPLVYRDGKPMCPAVATAFDLMDAAAHADGRDLVVNSGFRSDAEQAVLFARHPDPKWVAPPGHSRHRHATELDIAATRGAWQWLAANASRFGFIQRYSWEPWHYGYLPGCEGGGTRDVALGVDRQPPPLPSWVPEVYRPLVVRSAEDGGIPPIVLAALLRTESGFNRWAVSPAGAQGIAQFMPATARGVGLRDPFDPVQAIPAAARLVGGHLRNFGSIPLALAAYNAGPGAVQRYGGVPPYAETQAYVARIMALAGDPSLVGPAGSGGGGVVLVRMDDLLA
jgi:Transglycosylase SLT domain/D-alanyl-D-alanine carboxypeptidase/Putative Flp pilus-assembly TadE/G-like